MTSKVVVTGGTGFLGRALVRRLLSLNNSPSGSRKYEITFIGRKVELGKKLEATELKGAKFAAVDLGNAKNTSQIDAVCQGANVIFHCAALCEPWGAYDEFYASNYISTKNLLDACVKNSKDLRIFVFVSTPSVYARSQDQNGITEDKTPIPSLSEQINYYSRTKLEAEQLCKTYVQKHNVPCVILRPRGIYGEGDPTLLPRIIDKINANKIRKVGSNWNNVWTDITYVENVVDALLAAMNADINVVKGKAYNITDGTVVKFWDLITAIAVDGMGRKDFSPQKIGTVPRWFATAVAFTLEWVYYLCGWMKTEPPLTKYTVSVMAYSTTFNISKAIKELGYKPSVTREDALKRTFTALRSKM